jgi:fructokinase
MNGQDDAAITVLGVGELLWDVFPDGRRILGGAPANFAYHAATLGAHAVAVSAIGSDPLGHEMVANFASLGMATDGLAVLPDRPTGTVTVSLDAAGKPTYIIHEDVAWDAVPWSDAADGLAGAADVIGFGSLAQRSPTSRATIRRILAAAPPECLKVFDLNLRQHYFSRDIVEDSLTAANVLKLNDEELPVVAKLLGLPQQGEDALSVLMARYDLSLVALTRGSHGSLLLSPETRHEHPGCTARVVDTVGAGDAFTAALAVGLRSGLPLATINATANHLAAHVCSHPGATPPPPPAWQGKTLVEIAAIPPPQGKKRAR